ADSGGATSGWDDEAPSIAPFQRIARRTPSADRLPADVEELSQRELFRTEAIYLFDDDSKFPDGTDDRNEVGDSSGTRPRGGFSVRLPQIDDEEFPDILGYRDEAEYGGHTFPLDSVRSNGLFDRH